MTKIKPAFIFLSFNSLLPHQINVTLISKGDKMLVIYVLIKVAVYNQNLSFKASSTVNVIW